MSEPRAVWDSLKRLLADALERQMFDIAVLYGDSAIRVGCELIAVEGDKLAEQLRTIRNAM